jgi:hypothetical protein
VDVSGQPLVVQGIYTLGYEGSPYELQARRVRARHAGGPNADDNEDALEQETETGQKPAPQRVAQRPFRAIELR